MTFLNRTIVISFIILLSLVSGAYGITVSVSTGDASGSSSYTESLGAKINDQIQESTTLAGSSLSQSFQGNGNRAETFSVTNNLGDHADVGFDIKNSKRYYGSYMLSPKTASYAKATEVLDVSYADSIQVFANANNRKGNLATSAFFVEEGSLNGYSNLAYANAMGAETTQNAGSSTAIGIGAFSRAYNTESDAAFVNVDKGHTWSLYRSSGTLMGYGSSAKATYISAIATESLNSLSGKDWYFGPAASNKETDYANLWARSDPESSPISSVSGYKVTAYADKTSIKMAQDTDSASGSISFNGGANNQNGVTAESGFTIEGGSLKGYTNSAYADAKTAKTTQKADSSTAMGISASDSSENAEMDGTYTGLNFINAGAGSSNALIGFGGSARATRTSATATETVNSASGDLYFSTMVGSGLDANMNFIELETFLPTIPVMATFSSINGYTTTANADKTSASATQYTNSVSGPICFAGGSSIGGWPILSSSGYFFSIQDGSVKGFRSSASGTSTQAIASQTIDSASSSLISASSGAGNLENDISTTTTTYISNGRLSRYSDTSTGTQTSATTSITDLDATGTTIDVQSHAENKNLAEEGADENANGKIDPEESDIKHIGSGDFDIHAQNGLKMSITNTATNNKVVISPTLPKTIKEAIILEPYHQTTAGLLTDYDQVVIPTLLDKDYAVLRYTDSGASEDKFKDLNKYNVVLINSHMNPNSIGLSTTLNQKTGELSAFHSSLSGNTLGKWYNSGKPPYGSMVFLSGCQSTNSEPVSYFIDDGSLVQAYKKATLLFGFKEDVDPYWAADSVSEFFGQMRSGSTAEQSLEYVNCIYSIDWALQNPSSDNPALLDWKGSQLAFGTVTL